MRSTLCLFHRRFPARICPNDVPEALVCDRPAVATNVAGIPEIMTGSCGCLVPPRDAVLSQGALDQFRDQISSVHSGSWRTVAAELLAVFQWLVTQRQLLAIFINRKVTSHRLLFPRCFRQRILQLVQKRSVAYVEPLRCFATAPAVSPQHLQDYLPLEIPRSSLGDFL